MLESEPEEYDKVRLVSLAADGNLAAQEHLVALVRRRVRTIALAVLGHPEDAEDATQNALLEILRSAASYRGGSLTGWADRIAVRTAARQARKRRVRAAREISTGEEPLASTSSGPFAEHAIPRPLLEYLGELPETRRTVLVLRHVLEYSIAEIAEITECSPNTVKDRLLAARAQIRKAVRRDINLNSNRPLGREP
jgi:RNA polymerase sigma-70 factor (ECF subfamily)